ncbi:hypothetical protein [Azospirillum cavernae]|uniref:hypothetical protein n=1 Tax=Azospirillum cavernae TaxID=2320860 RepID=UPI0018F2B108|nr:hypothetical protein [Azospirillum cavernae]
MGTLVDPDNPAWTDVYQLEIDDEVAGGPDGVDNRPHKDLAERTAYLRLGHEALAATVDDHARRLTDIEGDSSAVAGRAQRLVWGLGDSGYDCELFVADGYSWRDMPVVGDVVTVAGDDSVDCASTARLLVGGSYVVWAGATRATVTVAQILSATRLRATAPLVVSLTGGQIGRTDWAVGTGFADAPVGGVLFSRALSAVRYYAEGRVVVRRDVGDAVLDVAWRGAGGNLWTAGARVETLEAEAGTRDEVWAVGGGPMDIRVTVSAGPSGLGARVHSMVAYTAPKAGVADFVQRPVALSPVDGAENASETPTLTASPYRSLYGLPQASSRWQVSEDPAFGTVLHDHADGAVANYQLPAGVLVTGRAYFWRVNNTDSDGNVSPWSEPGAFTTGSTFEYVVKPAAVAPAAGATGVSRTPTLQSSGFASVGGADTHAASRWRVGTSAAMTTLVHDSGDDAAHLTSYTVPSAAGLALLTSYWWQARHIGARIGAGEWSTPTAFTVQALPATPTNLAPAAAVGVSLTPTLQSSGFSMLAGGADAHLASRWQIAADESFAVIVHDSLETASLTNYAVPSALLALTSYRWRCRHKGAVSGWSDWSVPTAFTTRQPVGEQEWTTPGVYQFVPEPGCTAICGVAVGGGHPNGGGGGLRWANEIPVTPGVPVTITVGGPGESSSIGSWLVAFGGTATAGGAGVVDPSLADRSGGGAGGAPGTTSEGNVSGGGDGNGGGVGLRGQGNNGAGGSGSNEGGSSGSPGSGGGGGGAGGGAGNPGYSGGPGGRGGAAGYMGNGGRGGDGAGSGNTNPHSGNGQPGSNGVGPQYGGGGTGTGGVRVIWGPARSYPTNAA